MKRYNRTALTTHDRNEKFNPGFKMNKVEQKNRNEGLDEKYLPDKVRKKRKREERWP